MSEAENRLDGNAAAGVLSDAFGSEMTAAIATCHHCGARGALATTLMYAGGPGIVLRCSACEAVLMRFARINGRLMLEARGVRGLELPQA